VRIPPIRRPCRSHLAEPWPAGRLQVAQLERARARPVCPRRKRSALRERESEEFDAPFSRHPAGDYSRRAGRESPALVPAGLTPHARRQSVRQHDRDHGRVARLRDDHRVASVLTRRARHAPLTIGPAVHDEAALRLGPRGPSNRGTRAPGREGMAESAQDGRGLAAPQAVDANERPVLAKGVPSERQHGGTGRDVVGRHAPA